MRAKSVIKHLLWPLLPKSIKKKWQAYHFNEEVAIYKGLSYRQYKEQAFYDFMPNASEEQKNSIGADMLDAYIEQHVRPDEYMLFHFNKLDKAERNAFLSQRAKDLLVSGYYGKHSQRIIGFLRKKSTFYAFMKDFFRREALLVASMDDLNAFIAFCHRHPRFFAKDDTGGCGVGARIIEVDEKVCYPQLLEELVSQGSWILEELIQQHPAMAKFNSSSVNTIRFPSFRHKNNVVPAYPLIRFGRSGSIVDNASQGGLFASIDVSTGSIITDAFDEHGNRFNTHPDTGDKINGCVIPQWTELIDFARTAHLALPPEQVYVAFDFALTPSGWVLVEGNWGDMIMMEISLQKGLRKEFESLLNGN